MRKFTVMIIPDGTKTMRQFRVYAGLGTIVAVSVLLVFAAAGYLVIDYMQLRSMRASYAALSAENEGIKGEARYLMNNLEVVKESLRKVDSYSLKLSEIINLRAQKVAHKTGIGPLGTNQNDSSENRAVQFETNIPAGVAMDQLVFNPVFEGLEELGTKANAQALDLKHLLSTLGKQRSLIDSVPALKPVNGWLASSYGIRVSPFTGKKSNHKGVDIAAHKGTPILAPADGVVIFNGQKSGFGNFIMIAHGYGVVSRYGHNDQNMVQLGQKVSRGDQIGTVGMSGRTTGPHLHYEIWVDGRPKDPAKFMLDMDDFGVY